MTDEKRSASCSPDPGRARVLLPEADLELAAGMMKALGHPVRLRMAELIHAGGGDLCVCEIERDFDLTQPTITHHLKVLREAGVIRSRREGPWVRHAVEPAAFERLRALVHTLADLPEPA